MAASSSFSPSREAPSPSEIADIGDLPFVEHRLRLFDRSDAISIRRREDRTVALVTRWKIAVETLPQIRQSLLSCLEPMAGKGDIVTMRICDPGKFAAIKQTISANEKEIASLETAIRELDGFAASDYLNDLIDTRSNLRRISPQNQKMLSVEASAAINRGRQRGQPVEEALASDEIYLRKKALAESQAETAKKNLEAVLDKIKKIETVLARVGC